MVCKKRYVKDSSSEVHILDVIVSSVEDRKDEFITEDGVIDYDKLDGIVNEEMNSLLIYNADMWKVMAHYQTPEMANFDEAWRSAFEEIEDIVAEELQ